MALLRAKRWDEAAAEFREAVRLNPDDAGARNGLETAQILARQAVVAP